MARAIEVEQVTKRYRLGERADAYATLRATIARAFTPSPAPHREIYALRDVDLAVDEGEAVGVIGRNGAGKSTLLKILCRITAPTSGASRTRGRVGPLLEVGTGFHPELTGRENVYLNGTILGMSRRDIDRRFDDIVGFADVDRFLDTPLKRYSSGMYLRLAFAVAAHLDPEILVVDEVLAVGDAEFQEKCLGRMSSFRREGRTVVFVSHDLGAIGRLCERVVWLERGSVEADGPTRPVLDGYLRSVAPRSTRVDFAVEPERPVQLLSAFRTDESGVERDVVRRDEAMTLHFRFVARRPIPGLDVGVRLVSDDGVVVLDENLSDVEAERLGDSGEYEAAITVPPVLPAGTYVAHAWIGASSAGGLWRVFVDREALTVRLWPAASDGPESIARRRLVQPAVQWSVRPLGLEETRAGA